MELKDRIQKQGNLIIKTYRYESIVSVEDFEYTIKLGSINASKDVDEFIDVQNSLIEYIKNQKEGFSLKNLNFSLNGTDYNGKFYVKNTLTF